MSDELAQPGESESVETADVFADQDFDTAFGLEPEPAPDPVQEDETVVTDPPVPRQDAEVTTEEESPVEEQVPEPVEEAEAEDESEQTSNEKLNWESAPEKFREAYDKLKADYLAKTEADIGTQFITSPTEFAKWMKEQSPTSYYEVGLLLATESAEQDPKAWIEYFKAEQPDLLAQIATGIHDVDQDGKPVMTMERLKAELDTLYDEDHVASIMERNKAEAPKKAEETPEQKRIREILEKDENDKVTAIQTEVFQPIEQEIDALVSEAGLEIKESDYLGKNFSDLDDDTKFKVMVNEIIPMWIDYRIKQDPKLVSLQTRLGEFIDKKDKTSAKGLSHPAKIAATNFAGEVLTVLTKTRAKTAKTETDPPTKDRPKPHIKTAANGNGAIPELTGVPDWGVTDADLFGK